MAWAKNGTTTLTGTADTVSVATLPDTKFNFCIGHALGTGGAIYMGIRLNNDSGTNYAVRKSYNGGTDSTHTSNDSIQFMGNAFTSTDIFGVGYLINISSEEKLFIGFSVAENASGAGTAPAREEQADKWANTSSVVDQFDIFNTSAGDYDTDSNVTVIGSD